MNDGWSWIYINNNVRSLGRYQFETKFIKTNLMMFCENVKKNGLLQFYIFSLVICLLFSVYETDRCPQQLRGTFCWWRCSEKQGAAWKPVIPRHARWCFPEDSAVKCLVYRWCIHLKTPCGRRASLSLCTVSKGSNSAFRFASYHRTSHRPALVTQGLGSLRFYWFSELCLFAILVRLTINSNCCANKIIYH